MGCEATANSHAMAGQCDRSQSEMGVFPWLKAVWRGVLVLDIATTIVTIMTVEFVTVDGLASLDMPAEPLGDNDLTVIPEWVTERLVRTCHWRNCLG